MDEKYQIIIYSDECPHDDKTMNLGKGMALPIDLWELTAVVWVTKFPGDIVMLVEENDVSNSVSCVRESSQD